ncbi:MAG: ANTAR domain-containing protein [Lachnospiraceae bacterium]|nr:ANTAR domain-containing protein [Lachnospiraceae bacterium]
MMTGRDKCGAVIVTQSTATYSSIREVLAGVFQTTVQATSMAQARQKLLEKGDMALIVNTPAVDEFGVESAVDIASHEVPVIVLVPADVYDRAVYRTRGAGVFVLARPVRGQILVQSANLLLTSHRRIAELRADNDRLSRRMEELGLITRAKCLLIEKKGMTEETAHRYLETEAMNHSLTKREVAQQVLRELD